MDEETIEVFKFHLTLYGKKYIGYHEMKDIYCNFNGSITGFHTFIKKLQKKRILAYERYGSKYRYNCL